MCRNMDFVRHENEDFLQKRGMGGVINAIGDMLARIIYLLLLHT